VLQKLHSDDIKYLRSVKGVISWTIVGQGVGDDQLKVWFDFIERAVIVLSIHNLVFHYQDAHGLLYDFIIVENILVARLVVILVLVKQSKVIEDPFQHFSPHQNAARGAVVFPFVWRSWQFFIDGVAGLVDLVWTGLNLAWYRRLFWEKGLLAK
jgi:hypothetical protein